MNVFKQIQSKKMAKKTKGKFLINLDLLTIFVITMVDYSNPRYIINKKRRLKMKEMPKLFEPCASKIEKKQTSTYLKSS